jgi:flagellar motor switch protein FliN/FliY
MIGSAFQPSPSPSSAMQSGGASENSALDRVLDLPLEIHVEIGRRRMRIGQLLSMGVGSVLELDALAGAPLSIYANRVLVAQGEAVIVGERYGVRITEILSPQERVRRLSGDAP